MAKEFGVIVMIDSSKIVCGIDFGTSNSAIAIGTQDNIHLARIDKGNETSPTALFFPNRSADIIYGRDAVSAFMHGEEGRFMRSIKRVLGTSLINQSTLINGKQKKFSDIIGLYLANLKNNAERETQKSLDQVVMGRPVHFVDDDIEGDNQAEKKLGQIAMNIGFKDVLFQYEPIAAAFAHEIKYNSEKLALVVDVGGGTSDFTLIKIAREYQNKKDRKSDILSNTGVRVGGNDFDKRLSLSDFMPELGYRTTYGEKELDVPSSPFHDLSEWSKINQAYNYKTLNMVEKHLAMSHSRDKYSRLVSVIKHEHGHRLLGQVERTKVELTKDQQVEVDLSFIQSGFNVSATRSSFEASIISEIGKIDKNIDECLGLASITANKVDIIILTGGSTEIPAIKNAVSGKFPNADISEENKLASVALGLGYDARRKFIL